MTSAAVVLALCRFGQDSAALLLWGGSACLAWCASPDLATAVGARLGSGMRAAVLLLLVATVARLPAEVAAIGEGWRDAGDPGLVAAVLGGTSAGTAWIAQALSALLLLLAGAAPRRWRHRTSAMAAAAFLAASALTGHALLQEGPLGLAHRLNDVVHVLAAGAWFGALVPVLVVLDLLRTAEWRDAANLALRRFSQAGHGAVALVLLSGVGNALLVLGRWPVDLASPYEALLDAKILAVAAMVGLALVNRYGFVPRLGRDPERMLAALRRATLLEIALGFCAVALVALFGLLDPGPT